MYKPGDVVKIVDKWTPFTSENSYGLMDKWLGKEMTIKECHDWYYVMKEDNGRWAWSKHAIAGCKAGPDVDQKTFMNLL